MLLPNDPPNGWTREDTPGGRDIFVRTITKFELPQGAVFNPLDDESKGVSCSGDYTDGSSINSGRGIRCETSRQVDADCDAFWTLRVDDNGQNRDKCIGINGAGATKPRGITKVQFDIEEALPNVNWILDTKAGPDSWKKKLYAYPRSN